MEACVKKPNGTLVICSASVIASSISLLDFSIPSFLCPGAGTVRPRYKTFALPVRFDFPFPRLVRAAVSGCRGCSSSAISLSKMSN